MNPAESIYSQDRWSGDRSWAARAARAQVAESAELERRDGIERWGAAVWAFDETDRYRTLAAEALGADHGRAAGSWAIDGNTTPEAARRILRGLEDGDPAILDELPIVPDLSGEWEGRPAGPAIYAEIAQDAPWAAYRHARALGAMPGGSLTPAIVRELDEEGDETDRDDFTDLLDIYEAAFSMAAVDQIETEARAAAGED